MKKFCKIYLIIMACILVLVAGTDIVFALIHEADWREYYNESTEAVEAGYTEAFYPVLVVSDLLIDGQLYKHYHAYRHVIIDGDYHEDILVKDGDSFFDKTGGDSGNLVIFARELRSLDVNEGMSYTLVDAYSICKYKAGDDGYFWLQLFVTIVGIVAEVITAVVFGIHAIVYSIRKKRSK